jgi:hypothetical protein
MNCDCCREQLPVGDGIDHQGQTLCLACYIQGAASSQTSAKSHCLDLAGGEAERAVQESFIGTEFLTAQA